MRFNLELTKPPTDPLRPINPGNTWGLCITAAAGYANFQLITSNFQHFVGCRALIVGSCVSMDYTIIPIKIGSSAYYNRLNYYKDQL